MSRQSPLAHRIASLAAKPSRKKVAGSLFLSLTHVLDVESNPLFRPSQSESAPARSGNGQTDAFPRQVSGELLDRATNQSLQKSLNLSGLNSVYRTVCWIFL